MFPACIFFVGVALTPGDIYFDAHIFTTTAAFNLYTLESYFMFLHLYSVLYPIFMHQPAFYYLLR